MSPRAKVQAGGILRKSLDNTWRTPESILSAARAYFGGEIPFDPFTGPENPTRAQRFCAGVPGTLFAGEDLPSRDGLTVPWDWPTWVNPPYGSELRAAVAKIIEEARRVPSRPILALLSCARWEVLWFSALLDLNPLVCFHRGRVKFISSIDGVAVGGNPGANMILGLNADAPRFRASFALLGPCYLLEQLHPPGDTTAP